MANKMLIDAAHPEETRVVVLRGSRVEEFDFESVNKKQLRGNIYLAKVTRVEPSLQAAFIDYGGNRHGFLAFSEIHPDYYQIPISDRQALMDAEAEEEPEEEEVRKPRRSRRRRGSEGHASAARPSDDETVSESADGHDARDSSEHTDVGGEPHLGDDHHRGDNDPDRAPDGAQPYGDPTADLIARASELHGRPEAGTEVSDDGPAPITRHEEGAAPANDDAAHGSAIDDDAADTVQPGRGSEPQAADGQASDDAMASESDVGIDHDTHEQERARNERPGPSGHQHDHDEDDESDAEDEHVEQIGGDAMEEIPVRSYRARKQYKIQEVIKRRQVLLVQVVKEERGNKGAALTTYLSLAGRYSVLMPNTARGGGISRKITDASDRQRLKSIAQDLDVPDGMGVILRTAGAARTKPEVKRDFEYLMRMWETVRETTLGSTAPTLVYEEGSLIKRAIRDLYNKDVEEVVVAGEEGYREAKDFMQLLMPSHGKNVQPWRDPAPIFTKAGAEAQLDAMFSSHVTLKSGGYIVINQTEALVAIDVNSGRSTREHNIEDTALRTNLEASDEVARQLRLRDLAGLIVVDFIDMEESRNNRAVERRLKEALKNDRARIQVGRISHFGLLEMSRQRIRTGVLEGSTVVCEHCAGAGSVRSTSSISLHVLRLLEDALLSDASRNITARARGEVALYVLNHKRSHLADLEARFGVMITFESDESLTGMQYCAIERGEPATGVVRAPRQIPIYEPEPEDIAAAESAEDDGDAVAAEGEPEGAAIESEAREIGDGRRKRRRRRGRGRDRDSSGIAEDAPQPADDALAFAAAIEGQPIASGESDVPTEGGEADDGEASNRDAGERGEGRRRRSRRGGRRTREGRERPQGDEETPIAATGGGEGAGAAHGDALEVQSELQVDIADASPDAAQTPADIETLPPAIEPEPESVASVSVAPEEPTSMTPEPTAPPPEPSSPRRPELVSSELDPARPKRSGWWQRAKATLGG